MYVYLCLCADAVIMPPAAVCADCVFVVVCLYSQAVDTAHAGQSVAMKIEAMNTEQGSRMFGRHFDHTDQLVSKISRESINALKAFFTDQMSKEDWRLVSGAAVGVPVAGGGGLGDEGAQWVRGSGGEVTEGLGVRGEGTLLQGLFTDQMSKEDWRLVRGGGGKGQIGRAACAVMSHQGGAACFN
jgi:hypothetical protein